MNQYTIYLVEGDEPYVTMNGDFSVDDLQAIIDEVKEKQKEEGDE